ncbi:MAG: RHS repeat-associated core domain-containing protein [Clostridia bacterium]|nr:RHS repeat-associated core domain-containing protein [Clostridia bacterium]
MTWTDGRRLSSIQGIGSYSYDSSGIRISKTVGEVTHTYYLDGSKIICEQISDGTTLHFFYDDAGRLFAFENGSTRYYYVRNVLGEITGIIDTNGDYVVKYTYDAWGKPLDILDGSGNDVSNNATHIANVNPFRFKGYYYDTESGLYYLQSRYYDPNTGRFINADGYISTGQGFLGYNMFVYCGNTPVCRVDPKGHFWKELWETLTQTLQQASGYFAVAAGVSQIDSPIPGPADIISGVLLIGGVLTCIGIATYDTITAPDSTVSLPKIEQQSEEKPTSTYIYRYGGANPSNLTPREKDKMTGLSFSTIPRPGAAVTTIEAINATQIVYAVRDGATHVSVKPVGSTMDEWINAGKESIWTQAVRFVIIKWDERD